MNERQQFDHDETCDGCGASVRALTDTLAGGLCDTCAARFIEASSKLVAIGIRYHRRKELAAVMATVEEIGQESIDARDLKE